MFTPKTCRPHFNVYTYIVSVGCQIMYGSSLLVMGGSWLATSSSWFVVGAFLTRVS